MTVIWLGPHHEHGVTSAAPAPGVACALTAGEGPHVSPKTSLNEDSLAVMTVAGDGVAAMVVDAHHGHQAGERLMDGVLAQLAAHVPAALEELEEAVLAADERASRRARDSSESTLLVVLQHGPQVMWVSVGDSMLLHVDPAGATRQVNPRLAVFGGGTLALRHLLKHPAWQKDQLLATGELTLAPKAHLMLATDGLEDETSGIPLSDVGAWLVGSGSLEERVRGLVSRAGSRGAGGGGDNVGVVVTSANAGRAD